MHQALLIVTIKLEIKSIISKAMQYRQDVRQSAVQHHWIPIVIMRSIWHNPCGWLFTSEKFPLQICDSCGATYWQLQKGSAL